MNKRNCLLLLTAGVFWGTSGIFVNALSGLGISSAMISCCRVIPAFFFLLLAAGLRHGRDLFRIDRKTLFFCALTGIVCQGLFNLCYTSAIRSLGMSFSAVLLYLAPAMTAITSALVFRERITAGKCQALILNILGCALTVTGGHLAGLTLPPAGILLGIGAAFFYSLAAIFGRMTTSDAPPLVSTTWVFFFAAIFMVLSAKPWQEIAVIPASAVPTVLGYALLPTALAYVVYFAGLRGVTETSRVPVITSAEPVTASLIGFFVFREALHFPNWLGIVLVLCSIVLMNRKPAVRVRHGKDVPFLRQDRQPHRSL